MTRLPLIARELVRLAAVSGFLAWMIGVMALIAPERLPS